MDRVRHAPNTNAMILSTVYNPVELTCALTMLVMSCIPPKSPLFSHVLHADQTAATVQWGVAADSRENVTVRQLTTHFVTKAIVATHPMKHTYTGVSNQTRTMIAAPSLYCPWLYTDAQPLVFSPTVDIRVLCLTPSTGLTSPRAKSPRRRRPVQHNVQSLPMTANKLQPRPVRWLTKTIAVVTWTSSVWPGYGSHVMFTPDKRIIFNATSVELPVMALVFDTLKSRQSSGGAISNSGGRSPQPWSRNSYDGLVSLTYKSSWLQPVNLTLGIDTTNPGWQMPPTATTELLMVADTIALGQQNELSTATTFLTVVIFRNFELLSTSTNITARVNCFDPNGHSQTIKGSVSIPVIVDAGREYGVGVAQWDVTDYSKHYLFAYKITNHGDSTTVPSIDEAVYESGEYEAPTSLTAAARMTYKHSLQWVVIQSDRITARSYDAFTTLVIDCLDNVGLASVKIDTTKVSRNQYIWDGDTGLLFLLCPGAGSDLHLAGAGPSPRPALDTWCTENAVYSLWVLCDSN